MKVGSLDSSQRGTIKSYSRSSSRHMLSIMTARARRPTKPGVLQQRQTIRVYEEGIDVTPKPLSHPDFQMVEEGQATAYDAIALCRTGSSAALAMSSSNMSQLRATSSVLIRSSMSSSIQAEDLPMESLLSAQTPCSVREEVPDDQVPPRFFLPSDESGVFLERPDWVTITLQETETFFIFEMFQITGDLATAEGLQIKKDNDRYNTVTTMSRKLANSEAQTRQVLTKTRGTYLCTVARKNVGTYTNNWVMYDTYAAKEMMREENGLLVVHTKESLQRLQDMQEDRHKFPKVDKRLACLSPKEQLAYIYQHSRFSEAAVIIDRILANNIFIHAQKRFTGLIKQDPCSLDLEFTYSLDLLWTHVCKESRGRPVSCFRWNYTNKYILAVAYGASNEQKGGAVYIWCAKNPSGPARRYIFPTPISNIDWSRDRPNLLVLGCYDGGVKVIDVSRPEVTLIRQSRSATSPASSPHWQVQWWRSDEQFAFQEQIYTCTQEGRVFRYSPGEDFVATEIMKVARIEGKIDGVERTENCVHYDLCISQNPGLLVLARHPLLNTIYFVGSDEGCIYRCSTNYLHQHIESFLAHDGPVYTIEFSPFCPKLFLTCGADWCTRIWVDGLLEPLLTLSTTMACVRYATWCPTYSTIIASIVNNEICIWDLKRKAYKPTSITVSPNENRFVQLGFTANGNQLVAADTEGAVYVYNLEGMPFPPYNQQEILCSSIEKALVTKPELLKKLKKLEPLF